MQSKALNPKADAAHQQFTERKGVIYDPNTNESRFLYNACMKRDPIGEDLHMHLIVRRFRTLPNNRDNRFRVKVEFFDLDIVAKHPDLGQGDDFVLSTCGHYAFSKFYNLNFLEERGLIRPDGSFTFQIRAQRDEARDKELSNREQDSKMVPRDL